MKRTFVVALFALLLLPPPGRLLAQAVQGQVVTEGTRAPVAGALVVLIGPDGTEKGRVLTAESGRYLLRGQEAGAHRLRVLRIGFARWDSDSVRLEPGRTVALGLEVPMIPLTLPELTTVARNRCYSSPEAEPTIAALWGEVGKALSATEETVKAARYRFRVERFQETQTGKLETESSKRRLSTEFMYWPVQSLPPESLQARGFVQNTDQAWSPIYYGPDAAVLFSDEFAGDHCFSLLAADDARPGMIGLAFEPVKDRELPDIAGTLWLDSTSFVLRGLEFRYTRLPRWVPGQHAGGALEFAVLPDGAWVVSRWWMRAPVAELRDGTERPRLHGYLVEGGRVTELLDQGGKSIRRLDRPEVLGPTRAPGSSADSGGAP